MKTISKENVALIHNAVHSNDTSVKIGSLVLPVKIAPNGCRCVRFKDIVFMEQNKKKDSIYAIQARLGKKITWGIHDIKGYCFKIIEDKIEQL
jgi:hypothetical protein